MPVAPQVPSNRRRPVAPLREALARSGPEPLLVAVQLALQILDEFRIEPLSAAILAVDVGVGAKVLLAGSAKVAGRRTADRPSGSDCGGVDGSAARSERPLFAPGGRMLAIRSALILCLASCSRRLTVGSWAPSLLAVSAQLRPSR